MWDTCRGGGERHWNRIIEEWTPWDKKRGRGRPLTRWRDELVRDFGPLWTRMGRYKKYWGKVVKAYARNWASSAMY